MVTVLKKYVCGGAASSLRCRGVDKSLLSFLALAVSVSMSAQDVSPVAPVQPAASVRPDDPVVSSLTSANPAWVQTLEPERFPENELAISGIIPLADSRHLGSLSNKRFVEAVGQELQRQLSDHLMVPGTTLSKLTIQGFGAPTGNHRNNEVRSTARAMELKQYLLSVDGWTPNSLDLNWTAEDWEGILTNISGSDVRLKSAAVDIIRNVDVTAGREEQLMMLDGGALYKYLSQTVFPVVSRIEFTAVLKREGSFSPDALPEESVGLTEMYRTAKGFIKGTREFNDLLDLSARLYPGSVVACINAAGVALMRGNLEHAASLLYGLETDSRAYCNYGVYYMLNGEPEKAEVYLLMAASQGVAEAEAALEALKLMSD